MFFEFINCSCIYNITVAVPILFIIILTTTYMTGICGITAAMKKKHSLDLKIDQS